MYVHALASRIIDRWSMKGSDWGSVYCYYELSMTDIRIRYQGNVQPGTFVVQRTGLLLLTSGHPWPVSFTEKNVLGFGFTYDGKLKTHA